MKTAMYDSTGAKKEEVELPAVFGSQIREDIAAKCFEAEKFISTQPYATYEEAGKRHSASGTISHRRHKWKGHYGKGISRLPRKKMWRRGTQFYWIGAEVSQTRGGRVAHPPQGVRRYRKINAKEREIALHSGLAATSKKELVSKRYATLRNSKEYMQIPVIVESLPTKTKVLLNILEKIFGKAYNLVLKEKKVRAGKGKTRGRKYKSNAGLLIVTGKEEKAKFSGVDIKPVSELRIGDLYPLGRLTLYTQKAIDELGGKK